MATLLLCTAWREIQREKVVATFDSIRAKSNPNCFAVSLCSEYKKYILMFPVLICSFYEV